MICRFKKYLPLAKLNEWIEEAKPREWYEIEADCVMGRNHFSNVKLAYDRYANNGDRNPIGHTQLEFIPERTE